MRVRVAYRKHRGKAFDAVPDNTAESLREHPRSFSHTTSGNSLLVTVDGMNSLMDRPM